MQTDQKIKAARIFAKNGFRSAKMRKTCFAADSAHFGRCTTTIFLTQNSRRPVERAANRLIVFFRHSMIYSRTHSNRERRLIRYFHWLFMLVHSYECKRSGNGFFTHERVHFFNKNFDFHFKARGAYMGYFAY